MVRSPLNFSVNKKQNRTCDCLLEFLNYIIMCFYRCLSIDASGHYTVCIALQRIEERTMSQTATRKGTREKKRPRYPYYDDTDFNNLPGQKTSDQKVANQTSKEKPNTAQEINQISKLFCKFLNSTNNRYQELNEAQKNQLLPGLPDYSKDIDSLGLAGNKKNEGRSNRDVISESKNQRSRDFGQLVNKQQKGQLKESKNKVSKNGKSVSIMPASLDNELSYHHAINEHLKNTYPNFSTMSPDMLRELAIPADLLQKQTGYKQKPKQDKKGNRTSKDENKPFKRQSFHLAVAYHIHLKHVRNLKPPEYVDPTYAARKLKQQSQREGQGS